MFPIPIGMVLQMTIKSKTAYFKYLAWLVLACSLSFIFFLQFHKLGELAIVQWDESRLAVNAAEMYQSKNYLVSSYELSPDLYNTKPPFMIWLQVASIHLFGLNEFAIRFPSALSGFLCILLCGYIIYRQFKNIYTMCLAMLVLACSNGFIQLHGSLTGDYDSLLALWLLISFQQFYHGFIISDKESSKTFFAISLSLAVMSKSAAALVCFPLFVLSVLPQRNLKKTFNVICYCLAALIPFLVYCLFREQASGGYLQAIQANDFTGRLSKALEGHTSEWHYYIVNLFDYRYHHMIWLLPIALLSAFYIKDVFYRYYSFLLFGFFVFLSLAKTRIHWYDTPALPLVSIVITAFIMHVLGYFREMHWQISSIFLVVVTMAIPVIEKYRFIQERKGLHLDMSHYELSDMLRHHEGPEALKYLAYHYDAEFYFYTKTNPLIKRGKFDKLRTGDLVSYGNRYKDSIPMKYTYTLIDSTNNAWKIRITGTK
jgi:4-amino-4-deoxy-L-arabinose transferase-like glycosyltransferase